MQGYVCYVDRFCGTLAELPDRLDYLAELGITYLHLMPLLQPRPGENDGGYAVVDYRAVDPRLGTMDDLEAVAGALHERGMSLCVDLVLNHTAREHPWAQGWLAGDPAYAGFYTAFPDRHDARRLRRDDPRGLPRPGAGLLHLGARGLRRRRRLGVDDVLAATSGTSTTPTPRCPSRCSARSPGWPTAASTSSAWTPSRSCGSGWAPPARTSPRCTGCCRLLHALARLAAPGVVFKAEAIVAPEDLVPYLGGHDRYRPECELAYHNQLMVLLWSGLATEDARLAARGAAPDAGRSRPTTSWVTYVRGHDDIGWAVSDTDAARRRAATASRHRRFLNDFYAGRFPRSFARGALFQENAATGDARISGTRRVAVRHRGRPWNGATTRRSRPGSAGCVLLLLGRLRLRRHPAALHGRRAGAAQRHRLPRRPRARAGQPVDAPAADGLGGRRAPRTTPRRSRAGCSAGCSVSAQVRRALPALRGGGESHASWTPATTPCWPGGAGTRAAAAFVGLANLSRAPQTVDADTVTGFGSFVPVLSSDGPPELRADRRAPPRPRLRLVRRTLSAKEGCAGGSRQALPSARG